jgi:excisionase family DNA binding protein
MGAYLSARQAANVCGVSERTIRNWVKAGKLSAEKSAGTFRINREQLDEVLAESARTSAAADRNRADSAYLPQTESADGSAPAFIELVHLVDRLQRENRDLAGLVGSLQQRLAFADDRIRMLEAPKADSPEITPQRDSVYVTDESISGTSELSQATPRVRAPWWRWWDRPRPSG